jgi:hypothetical protein
MDDPELNRLKFHWHKWRDESKAFWGRATLGTAILLLSLFFQFGILSLNIPGVQICIPENPRWFYVSINVLSWFLWWFLCFKFVDLLRHRVPNDYEEAVHTNALPLFGLKIPLRSIGHLLYLVFPFYAAALAAVLGYASLDLRNGTLPGLHQVHTSAFCEQKKDPPT